MDKELLKLLFLYGVKLHHYISLKKNVSSTLILHWSLWFTSVSRKPSKTGKKPGLYDYNPETNAQSFAWKLLSSPKTKKTCQVQNKTFATHGLFLRKRGCSSLWMCTQRLKCYRTVLFGSFTLSQWCCVYYKMARYVLYWSVAVSSWQLYLCLQFWAKFRIEQV